MVKNVLKICAIGLLCSAGFAVLILTLPMANWRAFVVQSASMEPAIMTGSVVLVQKANYEDLMPGDIITFIKPDKNRDYITHRIQKKTTGSDTTTFITKGDNNKTQDGWILAAGGVVGKVIYSIPQLGYALSVVKTKLGIFLLVIVPTIYIIFDEILAIIKLIKNQKHLQSATKSLAVIGLIFLLDSFFVQKIPKTQALISDVASINNNLFTVQIPTPTLTPTPSLTPTPTPTPTLNCGNTSVVISGNGSGSHNSVIIDNSCPPPLTVTQDNQTTIVIQNEVNSDTGGNQVNGNTGGEVNIQTADSSASSTIAIQ